MLRLRTSSLTSMRKRERKMLDQVCDLVDRGAIRTGLLDALTTECRSRAAAAPNDPSWHLLLGRFLMAVGDPIEAQDSLQRALSFEPKSARTLTHLGIWYEAAHAASIGRHRNVPLPDLGDVGLCANVSRFAILEHGAESSLRVRAASFFSEALKANLDPADRRFLEAHLHGLSGWTDEAGSDVVDDSHGAILTSSRPFKPSLASATEDEICGAYAPDALASWSQPASGSHVRS